MVWCHSRQCGISNRFVEPFPGSGFNLDFVPETNNRIMLATGGWAMKFVSMFGKMLPDLAIDQADDHLVRNPLRGGEFLGPLSLIQSLAIFRMY